MIGMMMMTFILFFAFVVNTGMLVNAKINLQNAADMAAYAGAAVQARQLNQISYLNYEMRRQYKKFLFRYYVMGNMAQDPFPRNGGGGQGKTPPNWSPDGKASYGVPMVCVIFNSQDNYCHLAELPAISIPPPNPLDAINSTLIDQLTAIEGIRQTNCMNIALTNTTLLRLWLWNTDPALANIQNSLPQTIDIQKAINTIRGLAFGIGLIPREIILRQRIDTLKDYVNEAAQTNIDLGRAQGLQNGQDPAANERTIEAFLSAYYTLGNHTFSAGDVVMDELTPAHLLQLKDVKVQFDTYAVSVRLGQSMTPQGKPIPCTPVVEADTVQSPFPMAVYKDRSTMTYYALRLKARAKVMFSPFGDVELKAYAAAQPFGSRIGPELDESAFVHSASASLPPPPGANFNALHFTNKIPNLGIRDGEVSAGAGQGWDTQEALGAFYQSFGVQGNVPNQAIDQSMIQNAYQAAMVPNPSEAGMYNILTDIGADPFVRNFDVGGQTAFWAPIFAPAKAAQAQAAIQGLIDGLLGDTRVDSAAFKQALKTELTNYFDVLRKGGGEDGEGFNIVRIRDPLHTMSDPNKPISLPSGLAMTDQTKLKSSWNAVLNGELRKEGRVGYSVKFVSFDSLLNHTSKTDGNANWNNALAPDSEADQDLPFIRH